MVDPQSLKASCTHAVYTYFIGNCSPLAVAIRPLRTPRGLSIHARSIQWPQGIPACGLIIRTSSASVSPDDINTEKGSEVLQA